MRKNYSIRFVFRNSHYTFADAANLTSNNFASNLLNFLPSSLNFHLSDISYFAAAVVVAFEFAAAGEIVVAVAGTGDSSVALVRLVAFVVAVDAFDAVVVARVAPAVAVPDSYA